MLNSTLGESYQNSLALEQEWPDYGIGDPYVMRYNGLYYLYCSTKDFRVGIKAWSSSDLIHWKYEGLVTDEPLTEGAYAPEVVYWNGFFYMYTSPAGKGHYVLRSESPIGPFTIQTGNLGLSIDGSVFIDDDGKWYFTHASDKGIIGHEMPDPYTMTAEKTLNAYLGHWTEGSMIVKRDGKYFITYTGNHVFSKGYRINYAVATDSPIGTYKVMENNPIVISTKQNFNGLGHSSSVIGPNLDAYYMFYHNLIGHSKEGPPVRMLNMDRIVFNGEKMGVLGDGTQFPQPVPRMPDFYDGVNKPLEKELWDVRVKGDETKWLSSTSTDKNRFTAEYNFRMNMENTREEEASFEIIFSYTDDNHFNSVRVDPVLRNITLFEMKDGKRKQIAIAELPQSMDFAKLHTIRVESDARSTKIYFDQMNKLTVTDITAKSGKIGYAYRNMKPTMEFTAFSNEAGGSSDFETAKPVPGSIEAVHYMDGKDQGFHVGHPVKGSVMREDDGVPIQSSEDGSNAVNLMGKGDWLAYRINVESDGIYGFDAMLKEDGNDNVVELQVDGKPQRFELNHSQSEGNLWVKKHLGQIKLAQGEHILTVKLVKGKLNYRFLDIYRVTELPTEKLSNMFNQILPEDMYGKWVKREEGYAVQTEGSDAKMYAGSDEWTDYRVEVDLKSTADSIEEAGLLFRVTNESEFPEQVRDSFMGYQLTFRNGRMILKKMNYGQDEVDSAPIRFATGSIVHIAVDVNGATMKVYVNDSKQPALEWTDANAWMHGKIGIRSASPSWLFTNLSLVRR
ncbi:family 43 glycosylhydrolase [Paenibacillus ferrarius]|uniref:family 43 glycosylhydrolase n=1 Tax=Paenibacillus ferrarius TaxID=1469647 RepID=UPI003D2DC325